MNKSKTKKVLDEASFYTGAQTGGQATEAIPNYEFGKDNVPTLKKLADLKYSGPNGSKAPQILPFPLQEATKDLAEIYLNVQDLRNKCKQAEGLPLFQGKLADLSAFKDQLNGMMVACAKLAAELDKFSLAP